MTQRDGMGREEGGGIRMGNTCISVVDHVDIWQNQYNIVKLKNKHTHTHTHTKTVMISAGQELINPWRLDNTHINQYAI